MITNINEFKKVLESNSYSNEFASWFTNTVFNTVNHPIYGKHKLTPEQVKNSSAEYKNKLYLAINKAIKNGDIENN